MEEKKLEERVLAYRFLESRFNALIKQRDLLNSKLVEIQSTLESIEEIEKSEEILFPLASGAYTLGKIIDKQKIVLSIGANIAVEKSLADAKKFLNERKNEIEKALNQVNKEIANLSFKLQVLEREISRIAEERKNV